MNIDIINDESHKKQALIVSVIMYAMFLAAMLLFNIMYEPLEEPIEMGVDLNYGVDLVGSGNIQTMNKANASKNNYDVKPSDDANSQKESTAVTKPVPNPKPQKTTPTRTKTTPVITSEADKSPVTVKKSTEKAPTKSTPSPSPSTTPTKPTPAPPARSVDQGSLFGKKGTSSGSNGTVGTADGIGGNSNGDGPAGSVGDQGDPRGTLDGKSLYGNPGGGGGGGASVAISGWNRKNLSIPNDKSSETGRIVFKIIIDDRGDVISLIPTNTTVSPSVTKFYSDYLKRNLSKYLSPQGNPPPRSSGTITINITSGN
jgi:periplasmic protein TonB